MHKNTKRFVTTVLGFGIATMVAFAGNAEAAGQGPIADTPQIEARVNAMLSKLTLDEKIDLLGGVNKFYVRGLPSIGLPTLRMSDGPMGVREWGHSTAYPGGSALAATWDPDFARQMGASIGQDARARGVSFLLAPGVNIYRSPMSGRSFEYFGEDPVLAAQIAVGFIDGVQGQGVIATAKHFAANSEEYNRVEVSSDVDERTLHELYLPAFEAAVRQAHVGAIMDGYNPVNGMHPTENAALNCGILEKEWGFRGIVMSDWGAVHHAVPAANSCLDLEMPSGEYLNRANLLPAIREGKVSIASIDDKVRRILREAVEFDLFDRSPFEPHQIPEDATSQKVAFQGALEGAVLLKNEGNVLPLDSNKIKLLAVIGPNATPAVYGGGGSSNVTPYAAVSLLAGLKNYLAGKADVEYDRGLPDLAELSQATHFAFDGQPGVQAQLFADRGFHGKPFRTLTVPNIDPSSMKEILKPDGTLPAEVKAIRFTATYMPRTAGSYLFLTSGGGPQAYASGQDRYTLLVNGKQLVSIAPFEQQAPLAMYRDLPDVQPLTIQFDYVPMSNRAYPRLAISYTDDLISHRVREIAAKADAVVIAVGFDPSTEREGMDRSFELPYGQEALIRRIADINPKAIVVLNGGGGIDMHRWNSAVSAVMDQWYPGQEGGRALAQLLFGEHDPEGKLPMTFDRTWDESPVRNSYYATPRAIGKDAKEPTFTYIMAGATLPGRMNLGVKYTEGLMNGYRYYAGSKEKPLFPFGFGLSYTTFAFSHLHAGKVGGDGVNISADVSNTGSREGAEVLQLYLGLPSDHVPMPERELKGFRKVRLAPGETAHVVLHINLRDLSYYDVASQSWKVDTGRVRVYVGDSASNTPLTGSFDVR